MSESIIIFLATRLHIFIVLAAAVFAVFISKSLRTKFLLLSAFTLPLSFLLSRVVSRLYYNPRPFMVDDFTPLVQHIADNGFPSDHTLLTATIASIVFVYNKPLGVSLFGLSVMVGVGRVLAGVHHSIDVAGSIIIAVATTYFVTILLRRLLK